MGKEELIQYFEDAIALETEIVTQENLVSQFEAMSENKKPVLVERKVQVAEPDPNGLDSETNAATFFLGTFTVVFLFVQLMEFSAAEPSFWPLIGMAILDGIVLGRKHIRNRGICITKIVICVEKKMKIERRNLSIIRNAGRIPAQK